MSAIQGSSILLYGPPKVGKTTLIAHFPRPTVIFATERGHKFIRRDVDLHIIDLLGDDGWEKFKREIGKLDNYSPKTIAVDTLDFLYPLGFNYVCAKDKCAHPADKGEYGKSIWHKIRMELYRVFGQLTDYCASNDVTLILVAHDNVVERQTQNKNWLKRTYEMQGAFRDVVPANVDCVWYMDIEPVKEEGEKPGRRALYLKGDEYADAETRDPAMRVRKILLTDDEGNPRDAFAAVERAFKASNGKEKA